MVLNYYAVCLQKKVGGLGVCSKSSLPETIQGTFLVSAGPSQIHVVLEVLAQVQVCPAKQIEVETCLCENRKSPPSLGWPNLGHCTK